MSFVIHCFVTGLLCGVAAYCQAQTKATPTVHRYFSKLKGNESWRLVATIPLQFTTYHTQGLTKAGSFYFLTSVKVNRWPQKYPAPVDGYDRDQGEGEGYLFKFDGTGKLVDSVRLGEGAVYHPGGIDFDGHQIWVPVCEYRPAGHSVLYSINPDNLEAKVVATLPDALGAVAYNRASNQLVGMNWGSRTFYTWQVHSNKKISLLHTEGTLNPHFYVDYQDCNYAGAGKMICSGLRAYKNQKGETVRLGGLELVDMKNFSAAVQLPVNEFTGSGTVLTNNPFYIEVVNNELQYYFVPEDDRSALYIYRLQ